MEILLTRPPPCCSLHLWGVGVPSHSLGIRYGAFVAVANECEIMSALALPIDQLLPLVSEAKEQTAGVVVSSRAERADISVALHIAFETFGLRRRLAKLADKQAKLISAMSEFDFSTMPAEKMKRTAALVDELVTDEREVLRQAFELGSEIRVWWNRSLSRLAQQAEHLDSIAESLHVASDDKTSALLAFAVEQFVMK